MSEGVPVCSKTPGGAGTHGGQTHGSVRTNNLRTATTPCGSLFVVRITVTRYGSRRPSQPVILCGHPGLAVTVLVRR